MAVALPVVGVPVAVAFLLYGNWSDQRLRHPVAGALSCIKADLQQ